MINMYNDIIPYAGIGDIKLGAQLDEVRAMLKERKIKFDQWIDSNKDLEPAIPWINIRIDKSITLTFVKSVLFEILLENGYCGKLPNGICIGMSMKEAENIEPSLLYNDDDEVFVSSDGYWIGDEIKSGKIISISIFLPDVELEDDEFWQYEWVEKYLKE